MQPPSPAQASDEDRSTKQTILPRSLADSKTESSSHPPSPPDIVQSVPPHQTDTVDSKQSSLKLSKNSLFYQDFSVKVPPSKLSSSHPSLSVTNQVQQLQSDTAAVQLDHNQITDDTPAIFAAPNNRTAETVDQQSAATSTLQQADITASLLIEKQPTDINAIITTESPRRIVQRRKTVVPMDPSVEFSRQLLASSAELKPMVKLERNRRNFIGQGRRSLVFIGTHNSIKCAFKCPIEGDQESQSNLTSEAFILSHISTWKKADDGGNAGHPNIIKYFGALQEAEQGPVLVLEYCQGGTLFDYLSTHQSSCGKHLWLSWCQQITSALHFLHTGGINTTSGRREAIIHNDVKPHNVLLDERMVLKLSDFDGSVLVPLDGSGDESESKLTLVTPTVRDGLARGTQGKSYNTLYMNLYYMLYSLLCSRDIF